MASKKTGQPRAGRRLAAALAMAVLLPATYAMGEETGWIAALMERLENTRSAAVRKIGQAGGAMDRADGIMSLAREENDAQALQIAGEARSLAQRAKDKYERVLARAETSLSNLRRLSGITRSGRVGGSGVVFHTGEVSVQRATEKEWAPYDSSSMVLDPGDSIRTGPDGKAELRMMADGSRIDVGQDSSLMFEAEDTARLYFGKILLKIRATAEHKLRRFEVRTPTAVLAVRGTEFAVFAEPGGRTTVSVLEGEVEVTNLDGGHSVMVASSQGSSISTGADPAPVSEIDPDAVRKLFDLLLY